MASTGNRDAHYGDCGDPGGRVCAQHRVLGLRNGAGADVAFDDLRAVLCGGCDFQRNRGIDHRNGDAAEIPPSRGIFAADTFRKSGQAAVSDEPALGLLRCVGAADDLVRERTCGYGRILDDATRRIFTAFLDNGVLQFHRSVPTSCDQEAADHYGLRDRLDRRGDRHVAGALPDYRAVSFAQISRIFLDCVGLQTDLDRDHDHCRYVCRDGFALHAVRKIHSDYFRVGVESRSASGCDGGACETCGRSVAPCGSPANAKGSRSGLMATADSIYGLFPTPADAQRAMDSLRDAGVAPARIVVMTAQPFEEYGFMHVKPMRTNMYKIAACGGIIGGA